MTIIDRSNLFYREGGSDKVYHLQLIEDDGRYRVDFQYGRRGSTLNTGTKITADTLKEARKIYDRVYGEKYGKGYRPIEGVTVNPEDYVNPSVPVFEAVIQPVKSTSTKQSPKRRILWDNPDAPATAEDSAKATTGEPPSSALVIPQLCNPVDETEIDRLLHNDSFGLQEKKDGKHFILNTHDGIQATNKKGGRCGFPLSFSRSLSISNSLFDGEGIGDTFHVFDLLELEGEDLRGLGYGERFNRLNSLASRFGDAVRVVPLAIDYKAKKALYDRMVAEKREGVVFKRLDAPFKPGRPSSGGDFLKFKFYAECSVRVKAGREGKRSVGLEILDNDNKWISIGNVTIPPNKEVPNIGDIVEIKYLYVAFVGGHLYQPVYKEVRDDIDASECTVKQLKYKANEED